MRIRVPNTRQAVVGYVHVTVPLPECCEIYTWWHLSRSLNERLAGKPYKRPLERLVGRLDGRLDERLYGKLHVRSHVRQYTATLNRELSPS